MSGRPLVAVALAALTLAPAAGAQAGGPVAQGKQLYGRYCLSCHGGNGAGTPQKAPRLKGVGALAADFYLRTGYMPLKELGTQPRRSRVLFSENEIGALVAYVASLAPGPPIPKPRPERGDLSQGQKLFTEHCAGCHQIVAEGGYVSGAVAPALDQATPTQIAEAVRIGPYVMPRFSSQQISRPQLDSIVRYVEYAKHPDDRGGWAIGHLGPVPEGLVTWFIAGSLLVGVCVVIGTRLRRE
jgi:ubiquinol-cytochrome c reductase cytochrome c subunit